MNKYKKNKKCDIDMDMNSTEAVIWNPETEEAHILNQSAFCLYELCCGNNKTDIIQQYVKLFPQDTTTKSKAASDAEIMLERFVIAGVIDRYEE